MAPGRTSKDGPGKGQGPPQAPLLLPLELSLGWRDPSLLSETHLHANPCALASCGLSGGNWTLKCFIPSPALLHAGISPSNRLSLLAPGTSVRWGAETTAWGCLGAPCGCLRLAQAVCVTLCLACLLGLACCMCDMGHLSFQRLAASFQRPRMAVCFPWVGTAVPPPHFRQPGPFPSQPHARHKPVPRLGNVLLVTGESCSRTRIQLLSERAS